jgi:hypothetical protein
MAKCILITFLYQSNKQSSNVAHQEWYESKIFKQNNHGMLAAHNHGNEMNENMGDKYNA